MTNPEKKPPSEAQLKANRQNARKSTGPKTEEGKKASSRNALKHGLRSRSFVLIHGEDAKAYEQRKADWVYEHKPRTRMELHMVEDLVDISWKLDRCKRYEAAVLSGRARKALDEFECDSAEEVGALIGGLATDPDGAARRLRTSARGCRWLGEKLTWLLGAMSIRGRWAADERDLALRLFGRDPQGVRHDAFGLDLLDAYRTSARGSEPGDRPPAPAESPFPWPFPPAAAHGPARRQEEAPEAPPGLSDRSNAERFFASSEVESMLRGEVERLRSREDSLREAESWSRAEALDRAACDVSASGQVLMRYETALRNQRRATLREALALRAESEGLPALPMEDPAPMLRVDLVEEADPTLDPTPPPVGGRFEVVMVAPKEAECPVYMGPKVLPGLRFRDRAFREGFDKSPLEVVEHQPAWRYEGLSSPEEWVPGRVRTPCMGEGHPYWVPIE